MSMVHFVTGDTVSGFGNRLAYIRWLWARGKRTALDGAFAADLGVGAKWYGKWKNATESPRQIEERDAIERAIGSEATKWLYAGNGLPPEPKLFKVWSGETALHPSVNTIPMTTGKPISETADQQKRRRGKAS